MRIISGSFGGRKLHVPKNNNIRPTSDKIRGAIFNMLASRGVIVGANVLDGFCGTGALGLEALSRGAERCTFVDKSRESLDLARLNAQNLGADACAQFVLRDTAKAMKRPENEDACSLIFLDPPYAMNLVHASLEALCGGDWLLEGCHIVCETEKNAVLSLPLDFRVDLEKIYGETKISLVSYYPIKPV